MNESKALLSQNEIDTLINFLQNHEETPIGSVLDQGSIDKLVEIIKFNNTKGIFFEKDTSLNLSASEQCATIKDESGNIIDPKCFQLYTEKEENGFVSIFAAEEGSGRRIAISPTCLSRREFIADDAKWGFVVSPRILLTVSKLFNITCSAEVLQKTEKEFAALVYGNENAEIALYYMSE